MFNWCFSLFGNAKIIKICYLAPIRQFILHKPYQIAGWGKNYLPAMMSKPK